MIIALIDWRQNIMDENNQCQNEVYIRDTYRYTGRGKSGFEMHYRRRRCKRTAKSGGFCWQHLKNAEVVERYTQQT